MALPKQKFREIVFLLLYSHNAAKPNQEDMVHLVMEELSVTKKSVLQAQEQVQAILEKQKEIDQLITAASVSYDFDRIQSVERNVLRLGVFELLFDQEIPPRVAIAESLRLARKFGSPESVAFVNAILDNIYKSSGGDTENAVSKE